MGRPDRISWRMRCGHALQRAGRALAGDRSPVGPPPPGWTTELGGDAAMAGLGLVYQPKLNLRTDRIDSVEALLRWDRGAGEPVSPAEFIPVAERDGSIRRITEWVVDTAIADQARMAQAGLELDVGINLSGRLVADPGFTAWAVARRRDAAGPITMEITETAVIDDPVRALANLRILDEAGIRIAIDDYGAGLSSLAYLKQLPARELKIDRLFIEGLVSSHRDPLLVRSTIDLAHALEMEVTAEGVETAMALSLLRVMGCDRIQGFHIARPMPLAAMCAFVAAFTGVEEAAPLLPRRVR